MMNFAVCLLLVVVGSATAGKGSPVQKVIELLDDLKGKVKADLAAEAAAMEESSTAGGPQVYICSSRNEHV